MTRSKKILLSILFIVLSSGCSRPVLLKESRPLMSTFCEISCYSLDRDAALKAIDNAFNEIKRLELIFDKYDKESELSKVNKTAGREKVKISPDLFEVIKRSIYYSELSKGRFDVTLSRLGYKKIVLDEKKKTIFFSGQDVQIDLGGIAKGYAVDRAVRVLKSNGIDSALVNIGGNKIGRAHV